MRCLARTAKGEQCRNTAEIGSTLCRTHSRQKSFVFDQERNDEARRRWKEWLRCGADEPMPDICHELVCGARTRAGQPCRRADIYDSGRCKFHGGLSTGPKTAYGKKRSSMNLPWRRKPISWEGTGQVKEIGRPLLANPVSACFFPDDFEKKGVIWVDMVPGEELIPGKQQKANAK